MQQINTRVTPLHLGSDHQIFGGRNRMLFRTQTIQEIPRTGYLLLYFLYKYAN